MSNYNKGFLYFICAVSAMGGLLFGYDWDMLAVVYLPSYHSFSTYQAFLRSPLSLTSPFML